MHDQDDTVTKTGTTTVALTTDDAVVAAADQRASLGGRFVSNKSVKKIEQVHPTAVLTMAGTVGNLQAFVRTLRAETSLYGTRRDDTISMEALATLAGNTLREGPYRADQPTLAGVDSSGPHVYDLDAGGGVLEADYVANGSGMQLAYGVLEREQEAGLSVDAARRVVAQAVDAATERDTASGNGVTVAEVTDEAVTFETYDDPAEVAEVAA